MSSARMGGRCGALRGDASIAPYIPFTDGTVGRGLDPSYAVCNDGNIYHLLHNKKSYVGGVGAYVIACGGSSPRPANRWKTSVNIQTVNRAHLRADMESAPTVARCGLPYGRRGRFYIGPSGASRTPPPYERGLDKQWKGSGMQRQACGPMTSIGPYSMGVEEFWPRRGQYGEGPKSVKKNAVIPAFFSFWVLRPQLWGS